VLLAVGLWGGWADLNDAWQQVVASPSGSPVQSMLPVTRPEMLAWIILAGSAGISEELAFRGYFQRQLRAMTGSVAAALGLQAVLFGVSHGYQGRDHFRNARRRCRAVEAKRLNVIRSRIES
jgi:membrane protease YdiL (CAAX protease family)